jgi:hypothetical protein
MHHVYFFIKFKKIAYLFFLENHYITPFTSVLNGIKSLILCAWDNSRPIHDLLRVGSDVA